MRYGGYEDKAKRRLRRELEEKKRLEEELKSGIKRRPVKENAEAGQNVILHENPDVKESWRESWDKFKANSSTGRKMSDLQNAYEESENGFVSTVRTIADKIGGFFEETESARVVRMFKELIQHLTRKNSLRMSVVTFSPRFWMPTSRAIRYLEVMVVRGSLQHLGCQR